MSKTKFISIFCLILLSIISMAYSTEQGMKGTAGQGGVKIDNSEFSLKKYSTDDYEFQAGFIPDKAEYVWGEPMYYFTYIVKNTGDETISFEEGGDYRGGRSESHQITAVDSNGQPVKSPEMCMMGGIMSFVNLKPTEIYTKFMPVSTRLIFEKPGVYTVTGQRTLRFRKGLDIVPNFEVPTSNSFKLTILPYSKERMAKVIDGLAEEIWNYGNLAPKDIEYSEPTQMTDANRLHLGLSSLAAIKEDAAFVHLISMAKKGPVNLRKAVIELLGSFPEDKALAIIVEALDDKDESIRVSAVRALGIMKKDTSIKLLVERYAYSEPQVTKAILEAMGMTKSPEVFDILAESANSDNEVIRQGAVNGLVSFGTDDAVNVLKSLTDDPDMDFREMVVRKLGELMRQPIDPQWLVPVIKSRKGKHSIGDAPRLMRMYGGQKAVPALLSCLDFQNPSIRNYYNMTIIDQQGFFDGALKIAWIEDLNRDSKPEEIESNIKTLKIIKRWVEHYYENRMDEKPAEKYPDWWGQPVDDISIRARVNQRVWPQSMPQLIMLDVRNYPGEGSIHLSNAPELLEIELNGKWYVRQPTLKEPTMGINAGHGSSFHNIQLDQSWTGKSDGKPLELKPGKYVLRIGLSIKPENQRTGLAISKPIEFEIIKTD